MTGNEINLSQMLARREARANEQRNFLEKYHAPLISFSMNIPGPIKTNEKIRAAFYEGKNLILESLADIKAAVNDSIEIHKDTGDELLISVDKATPEVLKEAAIKIENENKFGRLFDIDIIDSNGKKLSRENFRKCLICDRQAQECARSRSHSVKEMQDAIEKLLLS
ncbi:MAG: citrate lyase holo-[Synergistaceae bacterium]|nr:citrate lyase holo-[acyl-carrier protein] synthase [Synergistaceae bacterium]